MKCQLGSKESYDRIVGMANEMSEVLMPFFRDHYNIKLEMPEFSTTLISYAHKDSFTITGGLFIPIRHYGVIKFLEENCCDEISYGFFCFMN